MRCFFQILLLWCVATSFLIAQYVPLAERDVASGESPYAFSVKRELSYLGTGGLAIGLGTYLQGQIDNPLLRDVNSNKFSDINGFDRLGGNNARDRPRKLSDLLLNTGAALPSVLLLAPRARAKFPQVGLLYAETMLITGGVTNLIKATTLRPRPYVYGDEFDPSRPLSSGDRASFISGHTSLSAAGSFLFARVFTDFHPDSKLRPIVWTAAITLPAVTGYLRVRAARHFPSDVIAGYAFGATVGYLVPKLHRKQILPKGMRVNGGLSGVSLNYTW